MEDSHPAQDRSRANREAQPRPVAQARACPAVRVAAAPVEVAKQAGRVAAPRARKRGVAVLPARAAGLPVPLAVPVVLAPVLARAHLALVFRTLVPAVRVALPVVATAARKVRANPVPAAAAVPADSRASSPAVAARVVAVQLADRPVQVGKDKQVAARRVRAAAQRARWVAQAAPQAELQGRWAVRRALKVELRERWVVLPAPQAELQGRWAVQRAPQVELPERRVVLPAGQAELQGRWVALPALQVELLAPRVVHLARAVLARVAHRVVAAAPVGDR